MGDSRIALKRIGIVLGIGLFFASTSLAPALPGAKSQTQKQQTKRPETATRQMAPDLKLLSLDLWISNPGDTNFAAGRPITTDSLVRLIINCRNAGLVPVSLKGLIWGVVEGPLPVRRTFSTQTVLKSGEEDSDVLNYFGPGKLAPGKYAVKVELDLGRSLAEKDRTNNALVKEFEVKPGKYSGLPDLRIREARADLLSTCGKARAYRITATVVNEGTAPAYFSSGGDALRIEPPLDATPSVGAGVVLLPKDALTLKYETSLRAGSSAKFLFTSDHFGEVKESNETNNTRILAFSAPPVAAAEKADLAVDEAHVEFTASNQLYWLVVTIKNLGPNPLTLCKDMVVWQTINPPVGLGWAGSVAATTTLKPGDTFEPSESAHDKMPAGTYTFTIKVDPKDLFEEIDESNNVFVLKVRIPEDLRKK